MIVIALSILAAISFVVGIGAPAAAGEIRAGRSAFREVDVRRAAAGELARWFEDDWIGPAAGLIPGEAVDFPDSTLASGIVVERRLLLVARSIWMLQVRAVERDLGARDLAVSRQAVLAGIRVAPGDSIPTRFFIGRPWVPGYQ